MRNFLLINVITFLPFILSGQGMPAFRQFYFNPFIFNPAFTGIDGYTEISLVHRQQWLNFNDAPISSGFNLQYATQARVAFGFNFLMQEAVALRNTTAKATFAYRIPISANQRVFFGLSLGAGFNTLDLDGVDYSNDPTILLAADNSSYLDGNFGALYTLGELKIGFALPTLFGRPYANLQLFQQNHFSQLKNQLYSLSYKIKIHDGTVSVEPYLLYRQNGDSQNSWEAASILYYKDKIWTGASYNNTQGVAFFMGLLIKEKLRFGYSYELPPVNREFISTSSHEINLSLRLGNKKIFKQVPQNPVKPAEGIVLADSLVIIDQAKEIAKEAPPFQEQVVPESVKKVPEELPVNQPINTGKARPAIRDVLEKGYYIVVGTFRNKENALRFQTNARDRGFEDVYVGLNSKKGLYYVYVFSTYDYAEAVEMVKNYTLKGDFSESWLINIE